MEHNNLEWLLQKIIVFSLVGNKRSTVAHFYPFRPFFGNIDVGDGGCRPNVMVTLG